MSVRRPMEKWVYRQEPACTCEKIVEVHGVELDNRACRVHGCIFCWAHLNNQTPNARDVLAAADRICRAHREGTVVIQQARRVSPELWKKLAKKLRHENAEQFVRMADADARADISADAADWVKSIAETIARADPSDPLGTLVFRGQAVTFGFLQQEAQRELDALSEWRTRPPRPNVSDHASPCMWATCNCPNPKVTKENPR